MEYAYIKRTYGASFYPGDTVEFGAGERGLVLGPKHGNLHYVHVQMHNGQGGLFHPESVKIISRGQAWSAAQRLDPPD